MSIAIKPQQEERVQQLLADAAAETKAAGFNTIPTTLTVDPDSVIVDYAETHSIDAILMGAYGLQRIRRLLIGSTTTQVMRRSSLPVLIYRQ